MIRCTRERSRGVQGLHRTMSPANLVGESAQEELRRFTLPQHPVALRLMARSGRENFRAGEGLAAPQSSARKLSSGAFLPQLRVPCK